MTQAVGRYGFNKNMKGILMKYNEIEEIINKYAIVGSEKLKEAEEAMT